MTVNNTENKQENVISQEKVDTSLNQEKVDIKSTQNIDIPSSTPEQEDPNWRAFREARKKDKADREAAERRAAEKEAEATALKAAMEAAFARGTPSASHSHQNYDGPEETEDERIEKKVQAALSAREAATTKERHEKERQELPQRLLNAYPDYNQVVNEENGAYLEYHHPELYRSLLRQPENFDTCSDIYKLVKKFVPNSTTAKKESAKADINQAKPKSISSIGLTQTGEAPGSHIISEDRKAANWARMQKTLKGVG